MELRLRVYDDLDTLARAAAEDMTALLTTPASPPRSLTVALSGGGTPRRLYALLAQPPYAQSLPWSRLHFFWGNERCVSVDHLESNDGQALQARVTDIVIQFRRPPHVMFNFPLATGWTPTSSSSASSWTRAFT